MCCGGGWIGLGLGQYLAVMRFSFTLASLRYAALYLSAAMVLMGCDFLTRKVEGDVSFSVSASENAKLVLVPLRLVLQKDLVKAFTDELPGYESEREAAMMRARTLHDCRKPLEEFAGELVKMRDAVKADAGYERMGPFAEGEIVQTKKLIDAKLDALGGTFSTPDVRPLFERVVLRLPGPVTRTDVEGRFHLTVPDDGAWLLLAEAVRGTARLCWIMPLTGTKRGTSIARLNNENMLEDTTVEDAQVEALLRQLSGVKPVMHSTLVLLNPAVQETLSWIQDAKAKLVGTLADLRARAKKEAAAKTAVVEKKDMVADEEKRQNEEAARLEKLRIAELMAAEMKRNFVAQSRAGGIGTKHERIVLKNNKALENVTVKAFNDDGVSFTSEGGAARVLWSELPDAWVERYRDPTTAQLAAAKAAEEAAIVAEVESFGHDVELTFVKEIGIAKDDAPLRGSIVKVLRANHAGGTGWKEGAGRQIFVLNMGRASFENSRVAKVKIYPTGRRTGPLENATIALFVGSAVQALQMAREGGVGLAEISRDEL